MRVLKAVELLFRYIRQAINYCCKKCVPYLTPERTTFVCQLNLRSHVSIQALFYSLRRLFTGFVKAALIL